LLAANHLSDYLRAYIGYYYGCGYTDVKAPNRDILMDISIDKNVYLTGPYLDYAWHVACNGYGCLKVFGPHNRYCCEDVTDMYGSMVSVAFFASRPVNRCLLDVADKVKKHPSRAWRCCLNYNDLDSDQDYPVLWADLMGYHPISFMNHVLYQNNRIGDSVHLIDYHDASERKD